MWRERTVWDKETGLAIKGWRGQAGTVSSGTVCTGSRVAALGYVVALNAVDWQKEMERYLCLLELPQLRQIAEIHGAREKW